MPIRHKRLLLAAIAIATLLLASHACADDEATTLRGIDQKQAGEEIKHSVDKMRLAIDELSTQRYYECLKVVGHTGFCQCLRDELPVVATFQMYVDVILNGGAGRVAGYGVTEPDQQRDVADKIVRVRESCAAKVRFK